ncbi:predicted protein [Chaetoceros tenuissimus]|uniref:ShKT domain-containing protein n=1 Tax=Chaetoceros tenuissimus TaxID=426638 RepID=A0AAD3HAV6_9STRA|nr:predicted protein [Chaetoceros tenuissimus]
MNFAFFLFFPLIVANHPVFSLKNDKLIRGSINTSIKTRSLESKHIVIPFGDAEGNRNLDRHLHEDDAGDTINRQRFLSEDDITTTIIDYGLGGTESCSICGANYRCSNGFHSNWNNGVASFPDPLNSLPVNSMEVEVFGHGCEIGTIEVSLNGNVLAGALPSFSDNCNCGFCNSSSATFTFDLAWYNVGGSNEIKLRKTPGHICVDRVELDLYAAPTPAPTPKPEPPSPCKDVNCNNAGKCEVTSPTTAKCTCENTFINTENLLGCVCREGHTFDAGNNRCIPPVTPSPTASPTKSPTASPTQTATVAKACADDASATFSLINVDKEVDCAWLTKNSKKEEVREANYCGLNRVKLHCKVSCNFCDCEDDPDFTFELTNVKDDNGNPKIEDCSWLLRNSNAKEDRIANYCTDAFENGSVLNACTKSCGQCLSDE